MRPLEFSEGLLFQGNIRITKENQPIVFSNSMP